MQDESFKYDPADFPDPRDFEDPDDPGDFAEFCPREIDTALIDYLLTLTPCQRLERNDFMCNFLGRVQAAVRASHRLLPAPCNVCDQEQS